MTRFFFSLRSGVAVPELKLIPAMAAARDEGREGEKDDAEGNGSEVAVVVPEKEEKSLRKGGIADAGGEDEAAPVDLLYPQGVPRA